MASLNVLIENPDATISNSSAFRYFALKAEDVAIQVARTPLQIPVPQASPFIFDIGSYRPSLTISGVVDDVDTNDSVSFESQTYRVPTQFELTTAATDWVHRSGKQYVYILHSNYDSSSADTKFYDKYECAIQQFRCQLQAGIETRWEYTIQFVTRRRSGHGKLSGEATTDGLGVGAVNR
jgi:hypothetical protein